MTTSGIVRIVLGRVYVLGPDALPALDYAAKFSDGTVITVTAEDFSDDGQVICEKCVGVRAGEGNCWLKRNRVRIDPQHLLPLPAEGLAEA